MLELIPYGRSRPLSRLRNDMEDVWGRFFDVLDKPDALSGGEFAPSVNIRETKDAFLVEAEIPGVDPKDLDVSLNGDILTIKGEKKFSEERQEGDYHLVERRYGSFARSFRLPKELDRAKLKASHKDGILKISLPKGEKEGETKIAVSQD